MCNGRHPCCLCAFGGFDICIYFKYPLFSGKGYLLNNAYIYASKKERETMDKTPYYRQTAVIFLFLGITFLSLGFAMLLDASWIIYIAGAVILITLIYAIVSSIVIEKRKNKR